MSGEIDHPSHYNQHGVECWDVAQFFNFNLGNVVKYVWRAGYKKGTEDLEDLLKARNYLNHEIDRLTGREEKS